MNLKVPSKILQPLQFELKIKGKTIWWAPPGFEPGTSRTLDQRAAVNKTSFCKKFHNFVCLYFSQGYQTCI